jgi:calcium-dependent protein kinase
VKTRTGSYCHFPFDRKNSRYSEKDAAVVVRQMLKVAAECHLRGLVHRDMKPEVKN